MSINIKGKLTEMLNSISMNIGFRIKKLRKQKGMAQKTLAEKSHISPISINRIENGKQSNLTIETIESILQALNSEWKDLLEETTQSNQHSFEDTVNSDPNLNSQDKELIIQLYQRLSTK